MNENGKTIGIIGAMNVEIELLLEEMTEAAAPSVRRIAGMEFNVGTIGRSAVVLAKCGIGMVNATVCARAMIDLFEVDAVINTGIAGSLDTSIDIGDVVVATDAVNHIMDVANLGYALGQTPDIDVLAFPCAEALSEAVLAAAKDLGVRTHTGRVASGDRFIREDAEKHRIVETFDARCCEMEGAAIAQACYLSKVPCAIVRAISDKADGSSSMDYPQFEAQAARQSAALMLRMLEQQGS